MKEDVKRVGEKRRSVLVGNVLSVLALLAVLARSLVSRFAFRPCTLPSLSRWLLLLPPQTAERGREARVRWLLLLAGLFRSAALFSHYFPVGEERRETKRRGERRREDKMSFGRQLSVCACFACSVWSCSL